MASVFHFKAKLKLCFIVILMILNDLAKFGFSQSGHNLYIWPQNEKVMALYFLGKIRKLWLFCYNNYESFK